MRALTFTAQQARLVVDGKLDVVRYPITHVIGTGGFLAKTARFVHVGLGGRYWAALDDAGVMCGTVSAPVVSHELVYLAEPWLLLGGDLPGVLYEADATAPGAFWAPPYLMPWNASRQQLTVLEVQPTRLTVASSAPTPDLLWHWHIKFAPCNQPYEEKKKHG